jgi:tripartite-type tricarboxylate transporter receptor subunit TctC
MIAFTPSRRVFVATSLATLAGASWAQSPSYPKRPIRLIVAFPPGGSTNLVARMLGQKLTDRWGQQVLVDNRPGANGVIACEELLRSPADGYTLAMVVNTHSINPLIMTALPYDNNKDFAAVSTLYKLELVLVAHPSVPAENLREFIALATARPGQFNFAAGDNLGLTHLAAETFNTMAGVKVQVVPYKGTGPALTDTLAGHVNAYFSSPTAVIPYLKSGKLKAYGISGPRRSPALPEIPTFTEAGLAGFEAGTWAGILAPAATPKDVVRQLSGEIGAIMNLPDVKEQLVGLGLDAYVNSPEQFTQLIRADTVRFAKVIKATNLKIDK